MSKKIGPWYIGHTQRAGKQWVITLVRDDQPVSVVVSGFGELSTEQSALSVLSDLNEHCTGPIQDGLRVSEPWEA